MATLHTATALGAAGLIPVAALGLLVARRPRPYLPGGLIEEAAERRDPIGCALRSGLAAAHVAIRGGHDGDVYVGRGRPQSGRTVRRVLLEPLLRRVAAGVNLEHVERRLELGHVHLRHGLVGAEGLGRVEAARRGGHRVR